MEFPEELFITFEKDGDDSFYTAAATAEETLERGEQKRVARYVRAEVMQGNLVPSFVAAPDNGTDPA